MAQREPSLILLVDDDLVHRSLIRSILEEVVAERPYVLADAEDGGEALDLLDRLLPRHGRILMLTDQSMPGRTGLETIREARRRHPTAEVHYVLWSSVRPERLRCDPPEGPDEVAEKPIGLEAFMHLVAGFVERWETVQTPQAAHG